MHYSITAGFSDAERDRVAALYWEAFGQKLSVVIGPTEKALAYLARHMDPDYALTARDAAGVVQGIAGFKTADGALVGGGLRDLAAVYGWRGCLWRGPLLALVERDLADDVLLMDGICVAAQARGSGLGTALLGAIKDAARARDLSFVQLNVIDSNPRAHALYLRHGFLDISTQKLGPLRHVFGFASSRKMLCAV